MLKFKIFYNIHKKHKDHRTFADGNNITAKRMSLRMVAFMSFSSLY